MTELKPSLNELKSPLSTDPNSYAHFRSLGESGLLLPPISLGLWHNFGAEVFNGAGEHDLVEREPADPKLQREILRGAYELGITHLDLANNYGPPAGSAESVLGEILATDFKNLRDELVITTKAGYRMHRGPYGDGGSRKYLLSSLDQSLKRLGLDYVDIFYHHRQTPDTPLAESMGALASAVKAGKALYVGVSNYNASNLRKAHQLLADEGISLIANQVSYSMLNRHIEKVDATPAVDAVSSEESVIEVAKELGIGIVAFSPLQQGLLSDRYLAGIPSGSRATQGVFLKEQQAQDSSYLAKAEALNEIAKSRGQSLAQLALAWVLRDQETLNSDFKVTTALVGASSLKQLRENHAALNNPVFSSNELEQIDQILAS